MKVLSTIPTDINPKFVTEQLFSTLYPLSTDIINRVESLLDPGTTVVLFSGGFCLPWPVNYIEARMFQSANVDWKPNTMFVDPSQASLLEYVLKKLNPTNILILNSAVFIKYRSWEKIQHDVDCYKNIAKKVIVTLPITRFDFNRLKYSAHDIAKILKAELLNDTVIICQ
jgi:hypothetical protein